MKTPLRVPPPRVPRPQIWLALMAVAIAAFAAVGVAPHAFADPGETKPAPPPVQHSQPPALLDGACGYLPLSSGVGQTVPGETFLHFTQPNIYWTAVGVRPRPTDDWAITAYDTAGIDGFCVNDSLAHSDRPQGFVDAVIGDFNHMALKSHYARAYPTLGTDPATVEWDDGPDIIPVNGYPTLRTTGSNDVLECFDARLFAGTNYSFTIASTGQAIMGMYVFRNPAAAPYWVSLDDAEVSLTATSEGTTVNYLAPVTDWYGIVVVNENGESADYRVEVNTCFAHATLSAGVAQGATNSPTPFRFTQGDAAWAAVGSRAANATQNWDISVWRDYAAAAAEPCWTELYASSGMGFDKVDVVAVDFNYTTQGPTHVRAVPAGATNTPGMIVWDAGSDVVTVGEPALTQSTGPSHIVRMWDVTLEAGHVYRIEITAHSTIGGPAPDCRALLFRNHNGEAAYAAGRQDADLATSSFAPYAAPTSGRYGLAVVNDNGEVGEFTISVTEQDMVDAPLPGPRGVTRLVGVTPNPVAFGSAARIEFELAAPARVGFELVDVAGRVRSRFEPPAMFGAGSSVATWAVPGLTLGSSRGPASGVYFLRMTVDGRPAGATRLVMLMGR